MAVPKKRVSISKKRIRKNIWKKKGDRAALKAFALGKSFSTGNSKTFVLNSKGFALNSKAKGFAKKNN